MAKNNNLTDFLTGVADAIRTKKGTTAKINPQNFETEIATILPAKEEETKYVSLNFGNKDTQTVDATSGKVMSSIIIFRPDELRNYNIKSGVEIAGVVGSLNVTKPQLYAPSISIDGNFLIISDNADNGAFTKSYDFNAQPINAQPPTHLIVQKTTRLYIGDLFKKSGNYKVTLKSYNSLFEKSPPSNEVEYNVTIHTVTYSLVNVNKTSLGGDIVAEGDVANYVQRFAAENGYTLPTEINVSGATYSWDSQNGRLSLINVTGDVTVTITGVAESPT